MQGYSANWGRIHIWTPRQASRMEWEIRKSTSWRNRECYNSPRWWDSTILAADHKLLEHPMKAENHFVHLKSTSEHFNQDIEIACKLSLFTLSDERKTTNKHHKKSKYRCQYWHHMRWLWWSRSSPIRVSLPPLADNDVDTQLGRTVLVCLGTGLE